MIKHTRATHGAVRALLVTIAIVATSTFFPVAGAGASEPGRVVISEFRVRGPAGGNDEFIELHNAGGTAIDISGWRINGSNASGTVGTRTTIPASTVIAPGCFYLLTFSGTYSGSVAGDHTYSTGITDDGGIGLLMPLGDNTVVDQVGMSSGSAYKEGTPLASLGSTNLDRGYERLPGGSQGHDQDTNDNATDFALVAPSSPNNSQSACLGESSSPALSIADAEILEGPAGVNSTLNFTVTLSADVDGGVCVDYSTADDTATAGIDYVEAADTICFGGTAGETQQIGITVIGDDVAEPDETFTVTLSNPVAGDPVAIARAVATGTIINDDCAPITPIHAIQGSGQLSPFDGQAGITTRGVVTGVRSNSYYIQTPDGEDDGDDATSEGLYVFTGPGNVPPGLAIGELLCVTGTITEFVPPADPQQLPITEMVSVSSTVRLGGGHPLPAPVVIDVQDPDGGLEQLERYEFMRVTVPALRVAAPTTPSNSAVFFGVVDGQPRPMREPGVTVLDPLPDEAPANVPRWDFNPELLRVHTTLLNSGGSFPVRAGARVANLTGVLDYGFRRYTIAPTTDDAAAIVVDQMPSGVAPPAPRHTDVTIAAFNVENLLDNGGVVWNRKANKISTVVREYLHTPDILALVEVADPATMNALAARINADAVAAGDGDPAYVGYMTATEGNQRLAFLIRTDEVAAGVPRVAFEDAQEYGAGLGVLCPDGVSFTSGALNDRPPLVLNATVHAGNGAQYPLTVIANHLKSLIGVDSSADAGAAYACFNEPGNPGGGEGRRNRAKRQQGAEYLATLVATLQADAPGRPLVLVGDFNAFEFNDGYADVIGTVIGLPSPDEETVVPGDGIDLLDPDLVPLGLLLPQPQRYSYVFDGNAQTLDHAIIDQAVLDSTLEVRVEYARVNADFTGVDGLDTGVPYRSSDHDPVLAYLAASAFHSADLELTGVDVPSAAVGAEIDLLLQLANLGADTAVAPRIALTLPAGTVHVEATADAGWTCVTPPPGETGSVGCAADRLDDQASSAFAVRVGLTAAVAGQTVAFVVSADADSTDPETGNNVRVFEIDVSTRPAAIFADGFEGD